jgi:hypothetical protein
LSESFDRFLQPLPGQQVSEVAHAAPPLQRQREFPCTLLQASPGAQLRPLHTQRLVVVLQLALKPGVITHCEVVVQPHAVPLHLKPPLAPWLEQELLQLPQWSSLFVGFVSQPSSGFDADGVEQSRNPELQTGAHAPLWQEVDKALASAQVRLHAPQFRSSVA